MSTDPTFEMLPVAMGREIARAASEDAHGIPDVDVPDGWFVNGGMDHPDAGEWAIRSACWRYHVDVNEVRADASAAGGPYFATLRVQVGGDESFETRVLGRVTGIEPGEVQDAVHYLVGQAIAHEQGWAV